MRDVLGQRETEVIQYLIHMVTRCRLTCGSDQQLGLPLIHLPLSLGSGVQVHLGDKGSWTLQDTLKVRVNKNSHKFQNIFLGSSPCQCIPACSCCQSLHHNIAGRDLDYLSFPRDTTLVHHMDSIMLTGSSSQEVATSLQTLERHLNAKGWEINPTKIQGPLAMMKFLCPVVWSMLRSLFHS